MSSFSGQRIITYSDPIVEAEGVRHDGVTNIPGMVPQIATCALTNATRPFIVPGWPTWEETRLFRQIPDEPEESTFTEGQSPTRRSRRHTGFRVSPWSDRGQET